MISLGFLWWRIDHGSEACQILSGRYCNFNIFLKSCEFVKLMMCQFLSEIHLSISTSGAYISLLDVNLGSKKLKNCSAIKLDTDFTFDTFNLVSSEFS